MKPTDPGESIPSTAETALSDATDLFVEVNVRSLAPPLATHDGQREIIDRFAALSEEKVLTGTRVSILGERICLCETCGGTQSGAAALDRVRLYERWAATSDLEISVPFERRTLHSTITDVECEVIVPPRIAVAVYDDASLLYVFPCEIEGTVYTVTDALEALEATLRSGQHTEQSPTRQES